MPDLILYLSDIWKYDIWFLSNKPPAMKVLICSYSFLYLKVDTETLPVFCLLSVSMTLQSDSNVPFSLNAVIIAREGVNLGNNT